MIKSFGSLKLLLLLGFCLISSKSHARTLVIVTSFSVLEELARTIVSPEIEVVNIVPRGQDPHHYELNPKSRKQIEGADLVIMNGAHFEPWLEALYKNSNKLPKVLTLFDKLTHPLNAPGSKVEKDPHAWLSPSNVLIYLRAIEKQVTLLDRKNNQTFKGRLAKAEKSIQEKAAYWVQKFSSLTNKKIATSHESLRYFGEYFSLKIFGLEGQIPEGEIRPQYLVEIIKRLKKENVSALFLESSTSPALIEQISRETGVPVSGKIFPESFPEGVSSYEAWLELNSQTIWEALNHGQK